MITFERQPIEQSYPNMYSASFSVAGLRTVWTAQKGRAKPEAISLLDSERWGQHLFDLGCSACDDDGMYLCLIRDGQLLKSEWIGAPRRGHREERLGFVRTAQAWRLRRGDVLLSLHDHSCAMDCEAEDSAFLNGVRLV